MDVKEEQKIRQLFDDYLRMYASRDDRLTDFFSTDFSGFTGGGDFLVKDRNRWVEITRQDFAQVTDPLRIELLDLSVQSLAKAIAVATGFFHIHLPIEDQVLSRETARLVLVFRQESAGWKICHSSISIPYNLVLEGEVYPLQKLEESHRLLEEQVAERTIQLSQVNATLQQVNEQLAQEITERKRVEAEMRQAWASAEEAHKAKSQFLATMSHEIRTPLNSLVGFSTLARTTTDPDKLDQYLTILEQSSRSLTELVNDILDMSKIEVGRMEVEAVPFNLHQLVAKLEDQYRPLAENKFLVFRMVVNRDVPLWIVGDAVRLRQILDNLLDNALKFTQKGEVSCILSRSEPLSGAGSQHLCFEIRDTGIGISESCFDLLFLPFRQLDPSTTRQFGGSGLGLAIVHSLVKLMHGEIRVDSRKDIGSRFIVELPLQETQAVAPDIKQSNLLPHAKVLIVEDNQFNRRLFADILLDWGLQVVLAENGKEALQYVDQQLFDLIVLDIRMPDIDGIEVARRIRQRDQEYPESPVPIVAITADTDVATRTACFEVGVNAVLSKPVIPDQLARTIATLFDKNPTTTEGGALRLNMQTQKGLGHDLERASQYRKLLRKDIADQLHRLHLALRQNERSEIRLRAHTLKGLLGQLTNLSLVRQADWLQQNAESALFEKLQQAFEQLKSACQNMMAS